MKTHIASMALLALGLSAGVNAHASSAQLTISNLQVRLIDLDLSDGITPALSLNASFTSLVAGGQTTSATSIEAPLGPLTVVNGSSTWSAQSFGGSLLTTPGWSATALTSGTSGLHNSSTTVSMQSYFTLTANTLLLITGSFAAQLSATPGDYAGAESRLSLSADNGATQTVNNVYDVITNAGYHFTQGGNVVQVSYANIVGTSVDGQLGIYMMASVDNAFRPPVPEPATTVLMLGGLASVAGVARRKSPR